MGLHTVLYRGANAGGGALGTIPIVSAPFDNVAPNNTFLPPMDMDILGAFGFSATLSQAKITTALLLQTAELQVWPFVIGAAPVTNYNWADFTKSPISVRRNENVNVQIATTGAGETGSVIVFLGDKIYGYPQGGRRMRIRMTSNTAVAAGAWSTVPLVPDSSLPDDEFICVGFSVVAATGQLSRLAFPGYQVNGFTMCPGVPTLPTIGLRQPYPIMDGRFGILGRFRNTTLPQLQQFSTAADATQTAFLDVIRMGQ